MVQQVPDMNVLCLCLYPYRGIKAASLPPEDVKACITISGTHRLWHHKAVDVGIDSRFNR